MKILVIDNHSLHTKNLSQLLAGHELTFVDYAAADYSQIDAHAVILSGSHEMPFFAEGYANELEFIRTTDIPVVGICLGCQLIAHAYGCNFHREEHKVAGIHQVKYIPSQAHYDVYEGHNFCINELCDDLLPVAASEYGYEILKHRQKKQVGVQFHPEVNEPDNDGGVLFMTVLSEIIG